MLKGLPDGKCARQIESMNVASLSSLVFAGSVAAGFLGSLTGLGGGVVIVPLLTLVFGIDLHYAIGASLVSVIATSSGAAASYVRDGYSNVRIGLFLEIATTSGALLGASLVSHVPTSTIATIFGVVLLYSVSGCTSMAAIPRATVRPNTRFGAYPWDSPSWSAPGRFPACWGSARAL